MILIITFLRIKECITFLQTKNDILQYIYITSLQVFQVKQGIGTLVLYDT